MSDRKLGGERTSEITVTFLFVASFHCFRGEIGCSEIPATSLTNAEEGVGLMIIPF
jgi:hypothetical protein